MGSNNCDLPCYYFVGDVLPTDVSSSTTKIEHLNESTGTNAVLFEPCFLSVHILLTTAEKEWSFIQNHWNQCVNLFTLFCNKNNIILDRFSLL